MNADHRHLEHAHDVPHARAERWTTLLWILAVAVFLAGVVHPLRRYVLEPRRQAVLGLVEPPGQRLSACSQFGFRASAGTTFVLLPGAPALEWADVQAQAFTLILGGFRGPYIVYLWAEAEEEKQRKIHFDLIDRYTKIAALQGSYPEVWVFHAWNLIYNVSVQWQSLPRKYEWIRRGIEFLREGIRRNPDNAEIIAEMGRVYSEKLGRSKESFYYRKRVEEEEGRSVFLIAYEWFDLARKMNDRYGTMGRSMGKPVMYSQACHNLSYYAKELAQKAYDDFQASVNARAAGNETLARRAFDRGHERLRQSVDAWAWACREWEEQAIRFDQEGASPILLERYRFFFEEAKSNHKALGALAADITYDNLPEHFRHMTRPEII